MKKILSLIVAALFFMALLAAIFFKVFIPSKVSSMPEPSGTPEAVVAWCYASYIGLLTSSPGTQDAATIGTRCFTKEFITSWNGEGTEDYNPVIISQKPLPSWSKSIQVGVSTATNAGENVDLKLGTNSEVKSLVVSLTQEDGMWKISHVAPK